MRLSNTQAVSRPVLFDRNGVGSSSSFSSSGIAPHVATTRWSYTAPAGRKMQLGMAFVRLMRQSVATAASLSEAYIFYTKSGGAATIMAYAAVITNAIGDKDSMPVPTQLTLLPGDNIQFQTADPSTAGTFEFEGGYAGTEGDL